MLGNNKAVSVTPVVTAGGYSAGDVVGGLMTFDFSNAGNGGILGNIFIDDARNQKAAGTLYLFNDKPTVIADNAPFAAAMVIADIKKRMKTLPVATGDFDVVNSLAHAEYTTINQLFAGSIIYAYFVCTATPTYGAVTDLTFRLVVSMNS